VQKLSCKGRCSVYLAIEWYDNNNNNVTYKAQSCIGNKCAMSRVITTDLDTQKTLSSK